MVYRILRFAALLLVAWCVMAITHEAGHLVGGWFGAALCEPQIYGLGSCHTAFSSPIRVRSSPCGAARCSASRHRFSWRFLVRRAWMWFIADFCPLANGAYLVTAWFAGDPLLDTPRLLSAGASPFSIALYCTLTIGIGYARFRRDCIEVLLPREPEARQGPA